MTNTTPTIKPLARCGISDLRIVNKGSLLATLTLEIGALRIFRCKLIQAQDGTRFVAAPSEMYTARDGTEKRVNLVSWPKEWNETINWAGIDAYNEESDRNRGR